MKKIPIHFNNELLCAIDELGIVLGLTPQEYGRIPKIIKFSITYTLKSIQKTVNLIPDLTAQELDIYLSSIAKIRKELKKQESIRKIQETP